MTWRPHRLDSRCAGCGVSRGLPIDRARDKGRRKRGGGWRRLRLDQVDVPIDEPSEELLDLDEALGKLTREDPLCAELVKLRFFAGLTLEEAAAALGLARRT